MPNVRVRLHSTPRYGTAALEADLLATLGAALGSVVNGPATAETERLPLVLALTRLAEDRIAVLPEDVLSAHLTGLDDDELTGLRLKLFEAGAERLRLAAAVGALLGLRSLDTAT